MGDSLNDPASQESSQETQGRGEILFFSDLILLSTSKAFKYIFSFTHSFINSFILSFQKQSKYQSCQILGV